VSHTVAPARSPARAVPYHARMTVTSEGSFDLARPLPATYWVVPGRLLVGEYPGSRSRADAMDRLRRFLAAGVTCFVDLTDPGEVPSYDALLPFATLDGRRVEYRREPIPDHGVPSGREVMARVLAMIDDALAADHVVYVHCRAGIGRSATVAGCWLASHPVGAGDDPLERLHEFWQQSARSRSWPTVPETEEQADFVKEWAAGVVRGNAIPGARSGRAERVRGALLGLAAGDATGNALQARRDSAGEWTQHTALALCLAESLLELRHFDARDQIERYLLWRRSGHLSARGLPGEPSADIARALATYQWRHQPMAGSHDPRDRSTASLPRVVSAAAFMAADPAAAVTLAAECSRTTHQSPVVLDACRYFGALLVGALRGDASARVLNGVYEPVPGLWARRPLKPEIAATTEDGPAAAAQERAGSADDVACALRNARRAVAGAPTFEAAVKRAIDSGRDAALDGALAGALAGAFGGAAAIPATTIAGLSRLDLLESFAARLGAEHGT
jgi:ADP-ribosyl-[dinitrogen reductase] hydrolase